MSKHVWKIFLYEIYPRSERRDIKIMLFQLTFLVFCLYEWQTGNPRFSLHDRKSTSNVPQNNTISIKNTLKELIIINKVCEEL